MHDKENRWIRLSALIPWIEFECSYAKQFRNTGNAAKTLRMALGSLIIKERLGLTDRETVEQIRENPYSQYFIGLKAYQNEAPFDASSLVYFRKRFDTAFIGKLNERITETKAPYDQFQAFHPYHLSSQDRTPASTPIAENRIISVARLPARYAQFHLSRVVQCRYPQECLSYPMTVNTYRHFGFY